MTLRTPRTIEHTPESGLLDFSRANWARVWTYLLGGKDHYWADRQAADEMLKKLPGLRPTAVADQRFLHRAVLRLVEHHGVRQFLDIGSGLPTGTCWPTVSPLHVVAQKADPSARVVYVDNDLMVAAHARVFLENTSTPDGRVAVVAADARKPNLILDDPDLLRTLDLRKPVALLMASVLHCWEDDAYEIVATLFGALPVGSYLVISHPTGDFAPARMRKAVAIARAAGLVFEARTCDQVAAFFNGLEVVEPGVVRTPDWHPPGVDIERGQLVNLKDVHSWVGVGRKPAGWRR